MKGLRSWTLIIFSVCLVFFSGSDPAGAQQVPGGVPDYFNTPNWQNSPPLRKFVDTLPGLGAANKNNLNQYIPVAVPDTTTYPGSDYYEIEVGEYSEQMHSDMPPTRLRGYRQTNTTDPAVSGFHYLGPLIDARENRPVRIKFTNAIGAGTAGNLFIPVDTTVMGSGAFEIDYDPVTKAAAPLKTGAFAQNRATLHLHGGRTPWISDGTPHQWITPAGEVTDYAKGISVEYVPDMWFDGAGNTIASCARQLSCNVAGATNNPGPGAQTYYWTNQQSSRMMFYHDHSWGITRLNVYAGEAAGYLLTDQTEQDLRAAGLIPAEQIPLIIQDKTFVDAATIGATDPTWNWGTTPPVPHSGDLWWPHVYMPAQNPYNPDQSGVNPMGRWHYGPWFFPPTTGIPNGPIANPLYDPNCNPATVAGFCQPPQIPGTPNPSWVGEAFLDTPVVNGTAYPKLTVQPKSYRLRILNAAHDRFFNLQLYVADASVIPGCAACALNSEVRMVPAVAYSADPTWPATWPADGREGGVPDWNLRGPDWIQIGNEGGFLPEPAVLPTQPVTWNNDPTTFNFGNVDGGSLIIAPAERADVIVDFSQFAGKTLILYNDSPAPFPALDPHYDYYTGCPDRTGMGGAPSTPVGYGPNTRTIMQIEVANSAAAPAFNLAALQAAFVTTPTATGVFAKSQHPLIVGQTGYNAAYNMTFPNTWPNWGVARISDKTMSFMAPDGSVVSNYPIKAKAIQDEMGEVFDDYGRMSAKLGLELPFTNGGQPTFILQNFVDKPTELVNDGEVQIWKITHNGVDTHPVHFHFYEVQLLNRVGWDGFIRLPDPNELGWKDTVRISPLEDTIVALRPASLSLPFSVPDSVRPLNPEAPLGSMMGFSQWDPWTGNKMNPAQTNEMYNFGFEYVWHCHILSHEENDMMRSIVLRAPAAPPADPTALTAAAVVSRVTLTWTDNATDELGYRVEKNSGGGFATLVNLNPGSGPTGTMSYADTVVASGASYDYRIIAYNARGASNPSNTVTVTLPVWSPATGVTLTPNKPSPALAGAPVVFTAVASGSTAVYQYRFSLSNGGAAAVMQDWGVSPTWTMPGTTPQGTYTITVDVRTNATSGTPDVSASVAGYVLKYADATSVTITPGQPSPRGAGIPVLFKAAGFGSNAYEYQFRLSSACTGSTTLVRSWNSNDTWIMPGTTPACAYQVLVEARSNLTQTPVTASVNYTIINYTLSGVVKTAGGSAVRGTLVTLASAGACTAPPSTVTTDGAGAYTFVNVRECSYTATASLAGQVITPDVPGGAVTVTACGVYPCPAGTGNVAGFNFTAATYSISGTVASGAQAGVPGVILSLGTGATATTDASGAYTISDLLNGTYTVSPSMAGQTFTPASLAAVTVNGAPVTGINFVINPHRVTPTVNGDGVISPAGPQTVEYGAVASFTLTPDAGNYLLPVLGHCGGKQTGAVYTTSPVLADCAFTVTFGLPTGDLDDDNRVTVADALFAMQIAAGIYAPTNDTLVKGDVAPIVDGKRKPDGAIDIGDVIVLLRKSIGLVSW